MLLAPGGPMIRNIVIDAVDAEVLADREGNEFCVVIA